jgi:hypothetical protein
MSNQDDTLAILKELVSRIKELESAVYNKDNLLMKSGFITINTPIPASHHSEVVNTDAIHKMSWADIDKAVQGRGK